MKSVKRFDIYWVDLDPTKGSEIRKTRPCVIISPDELNSTLRTVMVIPLTSTIVGWPFRTVIESTPKQSSAACDQLRTISKERLQARIGTLTATEKNAILGILQDMFTE